MCIVLGASGGCAGVPPGSSGVYLHSCNLLTVIGTWWWFGWFVVMRMLSVGARALVVLDSGRSR